MRVRATQVFPNCPRYIHRMALVERSRFVPRRPRNAGPGLEAIGLGLRRTAGGRLAATQLTFDGRTRASEARIPGAARACVYRGSSTVRASGTRDHFERRQRWDAFVDGRRERLAGALVPFTTAALSAWRSAPSASISGHGSGTWSRSVTIAKSTRSS